MSDSPAPAVSIIPQTIEDDSFVRQLRADNERLRQRVDTLTRRLAEHDANWQALTAIVLTANGTKGAHG